VKLSVGKEVPLPTKPANLEVKESEAIVVETPGAGGYGNPAERDRTDVERDLISGKFSRDFIRKNYGAEPKA
jgi:N-methylhydantoinase B